MTTTETEYIEHVAYSVDAGVALIRLERDRQSKASEWRYLDLLIRADADPAVRAVVVTGTGDSFCVGPELRTVAARMDTMAELTTFPFPQGAFSLGVRKPVIAAVNGTAAGMGLIYALTCDVRYASSTARFATSFARRGLVAERTMAWLVPRLVRMGAAMDLSLASRTIGAAEALRTGLVQRVLEPAELLPAALTWAHDVAARCSPVSTSAIKGQILRGQEIDLTTALREAHRLARAALVTGSAPDEHEIRIRD